MEVSPNRTTLLIGNGPNRLTESAVSWADVIDQLMDYVPSLRLNSIGKPFPLLFEEIALGMEKTGTGDVGTLKRHIASLLAHLTPNSVHGRIMGLGLRDVLTTNYDYSLERAADREEAKEDPSIPMVHESKFSLFRNRSIGDTRVWHIHGEIDTPRSITLGYDHYVSYLSRLQRYASGQDYRGHISPFLTGKEFFEKERRPYSWIDVFLRNDVHILGLALGFEEIDLWWLLTMKERLRHKLKHRLRGLRIGKTIYYHFAVGNPMTTDTPKLSLLQNLGVEIRPIELEGDWEFMSVFHHTLNDIRLHILRRRRKGNDSH